MLDQKDADAVVSSPRGKQDILLIKCRVRHNTSKNDQVNANVRVERARRLHPTFDSINQVANRITRPGVQRSIRPQRSLAPRLPGALRKVPKTTRNLNGQTIAQLAGQHDNLPAVMTFMRDEIG